jgi:uncharacterized SAM-binding protein YcdF (DUF218 family)
MFAFKKFISAFILPPGIFIVFLFVAGLWMARRKNWKAAITAGILAIFLWLPATSPVADRLMMRLENGLSMPRQVKGDVIILLSGGVIEGVEDLTGSGAPTDDTMARIVTAVRVQRLIHVPIIVSGGSAFAGRVPEAYVVKRFLCDLGVPEEMVILEDKSRDTDENARFSVEICTRQGFGKPLLVTSAYHMRRAMIAFTHQKMRVVPLPANFTPRHPKRYIWLAFLPSAGSERRTTYALHEYIGILFYRLTL